MPILAGLAVGVILAVPSPRYAPGYRPGPAASILYFASATIIGLVVGVSQFLDSIRAVEIRDASECVATAAAARAPVDEARWCVVHSGSTLLQLRRRYPQAALAAEVSSPPVQEFRDCFARAGGRYEHRRSCFEEFVARAL